MAAVTTDQLLLALQQACYRSSVVDRVDVRVIDTDTLSGWHAHPFHEPAQHIPCAPVQFEDFLAEVEAHYRKSSAH